MLFLLTTRLFMRMKCLLEMHEGNFVLLRVSQITDIVMAAVRKRKLLMECNTYTV